jgi:3-dehydroquinate synthase
MRAGDSSSLPWYHSIELGDRSYTVYVGPGLVGMVGPLVKERIPTVDRCVVVTSEAIRRAHGRAMEKSLDEADISAGMALVPDGEEAKSWSAAEELIGELLEQGLDRHSVVIAFGGGAVGDLSGFVASIFLRGVSLVQVPTTLLAQVDSSLGGKTAVNHPKGKNLIGSFHQPSLVVSDPEVLLTLPKRELLSGLGEVVKHGVIADRGLFEFVEADAERLVQACPDALAHVVRRSVAIKGRLVELDEHDNKGVRAILNYGHTAGHALEITSNLELRHGEAVALGMMIASRISEKVGLMGNLDVERQRSLLEELGFEMEPPLSDPSMIVEAMHRDKKAEAGTIRFVLPTGIGDPPVLRAVSEHLIIQTLEDEGYG